MGPCSLALAQPTCTLNVNPHDPSSPNLTTAGTTRSLAGHHLSGPHVLQLVELLPLPVGGHAPRLVHRYRREHEQHHKGSTGGDYQEEPLLVESRSQHCRPGGFACQEFDGLQVDQQNEGGQEGNHEFDKDPVVAEQAPFGTQGRDHPAEQRGKGEWDDDEPGEQLHRRIGGAHQLSIPTGQTDEGEREEGGDRAKPADRGRDMPGERGLTEARRHDHRGSTPVCIADMCIWSPKPLPVRGKSKNSTTRMIAMSTNTFTQRGVLGEVRGGVLADLFGAVLGVDRPSGPTWGCVSNFFARKYHRAKPPPPS